MLDEKEFGKILGVLASMWPRTELKAQTLSAYYAILGDLEPDMLKAATLHLGATATFFPSAGEIRRTAFDLLERETGVPDGYAAFGEVMRAVSRFGVYRAPEFSHPLIGDVVQAIGGWRIICMTDENDIASTRMRFVTAYDTLLKRTQMDVRMLPQVREIAQRLSAGDDRLVLDVGNTVDEEVSDDNRQLPSRS